MYLNLSVILFFLVNCHAQIELSNTTSDIIELEKSVILSRRKRFLIFAEGSSFQIVFCLTYQMLIAIGDIFLYGNTAALAWELPQDPYSPFNHHADPLHRRTDTKTIYYTDETGKIIDKQPFYRKPIVNPAFAKRSVDEFNEKGKFRIDRKQMHDSENKREYLKHMEQRSVEFHRNSRASLYHKMAALLHGLGVNGKDCVMKTLCLIGQNKENTQGSFSQEILKAIFTLPKNSIEDKHSQYDAAHNANGDCEDIYPDCTENGLNPEAPRFTY